MWDRPLNRKNGILFDPKQVVDLVKKLPLPTELDENGRRQLVEDYLDVGMLIAFLDMTWLSSMYMESLSSYLFFFQFKQLMLSIDPDEEDDDDMPPQKKTNPNTTQEQKTEGGITTRFTHV